MRRLLYLFGEPGTGKITVARLLQQRLGWKLFWLHDLDTVCAIVGKYPLPRLMDRVSEAVLDELLATEQDVIYVRPSRDAETRRRIRELALGRYYSYFPICLWTNYATLAERVMRREPDPFRVHTREGLDAYLSERPRSVTQPGECLINTEGRTPEQVADAILEWTRLK